MKLFTKEGAIILDPFMGSGTTAVSCINTNRKYIGFDINKEYIKICEKRITSAQ
jgi:DNA modification methylase